MVRILKRSYERELRGMPKVEQKRQEAPAAPTRAVVPNAKWSPIANPQTYAPVDVLPTSTPAAVISSPTIALSRPSSTSVSDAIPPTPAVVTEVTTRVVTASVTLSSSQDISSSTSRRASAEQQSESTRSDTSASTSSPSLTPIAAPTSFRPVQSSASRANIAPAESTDGEITSTSSVAISTRSHTVTVSTISTLVSRNATSTGSASAAPTGELTLVLTATDANDASAYLSSVLASYTSRHSLTTTATGDSMADAPSPAPFTTKIKVFPTGSDSSSAATSTEAGGGSQGESKALLNTFTKSPISITFTVFICVAILALALAAAAFFIRRTQKRRKRERIGLTLGSDDDMSPGSQWRGIGENYYPDSPADMAPDAIWTRRRHSAALREMEEHVEEMTEARQSSEWTSIVGDRDWGSDFASSRGHGGSFGARSQPAPPLPTVTDTHLLAANPHPLRNVHYPEPPTPSVYSLPEQSPTMLITPATPTRVPAAGLLVPVSPKSPNPPERPPRPEDEFPSDAVETLADPFADDEHLFVAPMLRTMSGSTHSSSATRFAYMPSVLADQRPTVETRPRYAASILGSQSLYDRRDSAKATHELRRVASLAAARDSLVPLSPRHSTLVNSDEDPFNPPSPGVDDSFASESNVGMAVTSDGPQWAYIPSQVPQNTAGLFKPDFLAQSPPQARIDTSSSRGSSDVTDTSTLRPPSHYRLSAPDAVASRLGRASFSSIDSGRESPIPEVQRALSASRRKVSLVEVIAKSPATLREFDEASNGSDESGGSDDSLIAMAKRRRSEQEDLARALMGERRRRSEGEVLVTKPKPSK